MNKKLIKKLRKGTIAVVNDGTLEELREVLKHAFPNDSTKSNGNRKYYFKHAADENIWMCGEKTDLPTHSVKEFLTQEKETMQTSNLQVLNSTIKINSDMKEINITPKEGFEIDVENSDLKNGKVLLKEVEKKYPNRFMMPKEMNMDKYLFSEKYIRKLDILDTLLCLRDEYNRIDGFTEGFRFAEQNWSIYNFNNVLRFDYFLNANKIMHFGKKETAKLFLHNFKYQLEQVKEFL